MEKNVDFIRDYIFNDLELDISINNEPYCYYQYNGSYKINLNLRNNNKRVHLLEECEVYKIVKKN